MADKRVLVINEDVEVRRSLREILGAHDWQVDDAASALEGLKLIDDVRSYGEGYYYIITDAFLPDLDGRLFLRTLRLQFPSVPIMIVTNYADPSREELAEELGNSAYLEHPVVGEELLAKLDGLNAGRSTTSPEPAPPFRLLDAPVVGYAFLTLEQRERAVEHFEVLQTLPGVVAINAVRGEYDIIVRIAVESVKDYERTLTDIDKINGLKLVDNEHVVPPTLNVSTDEFIRHFQDVHLKATEAFERGHETNSYLLIDIDRYQMERIYCSIMLTSGVVHCRVAEGSRKLIVLISGAVSPHVMRHLLRKLAEMDGILRAREIPVINVHD